MKLSWPIIKQGLLYVFFPRVCVSCGRDLGWKEESYLCPNCTTGLVLPGPLFCQRCGVNLPSGGAHCYACRSSKGKTYKCRLIRSAWIFNTSSRAFVHGLKYNGADYLATEMGAQMAKNFHRYPELATTQVVIPVPLFPHKKKTRGYNQSERLAVSFSHHIGLPLDTQTLIRTRDTVSQTKLGRKDRLTNMEGAFKCTSSQEIKGKIVLLIDDVATTGATLEGCAIALRMAGAKQVFAYTYAREN